MSEDTAALLKARIRADLTAAMKAGRRDETRLLRTLLAAIDNAEAQPLPQSGPASPPQRFADGSAEVARRVLRPEDLTAILTREIAEREAAAGEFDRLGRAPDAAMLRTEAALVGRYLG